MANRYWVGGTGTWSDATNHWATTSGGTPNVANLPTASDNVYFDLNSFTAYGQTLTLDLASASTVCKDMDWTGVTNYPSLLANSGGGFYTIRVSGSLTMSTDMIVGTGLVIRFMPNDTNKTINTAGMIFESFYFNATAGTNTDVWTINSDITLTGVFEFNTNDGTLNMGNYNIIAPEEFWVEPDNTSYSQWLTAGTMTVTTSFFHIGWDYVYDTTTGVSIVIQNTGGYTGGAISGGFIVKDISIVPSAVKLDSPFDLSISGNNSFRNFSAVYSGIDLTLEFASGSTQSISGTLDLVGEAGHLIGIQSSVANSAATLAVTGAKTADYVSLKDNTLTGGSASAGTHSVNRGNNTGWLFYASALVDRFDSATINPYLWGSGFNYYDAVGNALNLYTGTSSEYSGISSVDSYDLTGSEIYCQFVNRGSQDLSMMEASPLQLLKASSPSTDKLFWYVNGTLIKAYKTVASVQTEVASATYDINNFRWIKIRESGGTFYFDRSEDAKIWTNFATCTGPDMTAFIVQPFAGTFSDGDYNSQITIDNFNTLPADRVEIKFDNNLIVDSDRSTWITQIAYGYTYLMVMYDGLLGLNYYSFEAKTTGYGYLEVGDRIKVYDTDGRGFEVVVLDWEMNVGSGLQEIIKSDLPVQNITDYTTTGFIGKTIRNTEIKVDKQEGDITLISSQVSGLVTSAATLTIDTNEIRALVETANDDINTLQSDVADLELTSDALELSVSQIGGTNLLKNAVGLKGDIKEWQIFDENGDLVDARNTGTIDTGTDTGAYTESKSAIILTDQYIERTVPTIVGQVYTCFFRYKSNANTDLTLTGVIGVINLPTSASWITFKYQFTATSINTTMRIESASTETITVSDIVLKKGDVNGWIQAPNEVYGTDFRFDKDGFSIAKTDSYFKSLLTNEYYAVYDTSSGSDKVIMYVSKDSGKITNLFVQDLLQIQRYDNETKAVRFIPSSTGLAISVKD
jgi:hypothetical protein